MPHIEWRGGTCRVKWWTGEYHENGRRRYESKGGFDDEEVAYNHGLDRESDVRNSRFISRQQGQLLFKDWNAQWLAANDVADTTRYTYEKTINAQILPEWGEVALTDIKTIAIRAWLNGIKAKYKLKYFKQIKMVFGLQMADACENLLIPSNPMPQDSRRRGKFVKVETEEAIYPDPDQALELAESARAVWGFTGYVMSLTKCYTGMRLGEIRGLQRPYVSPNWPQSDPDAKRRREGTKRYGGDDPLPAIRVQWQHQYVKRVATLLPPKYGSHRTLVIPTFLNALITELLDSHDSPWVFPAPGGGSLLQTDFYNYFWNPALDGTEERTGRYARPAAPGVPELAGMVPHGLRHGHKTWLDEDGHPRVAVEERMGHELPGVEGTYSHVTVEMERRIMESLQTRWEKAVERRQNMIDSQ